MDINELLRYTVANNASDLHLSSGVVPLVRLDEDLVPVPRSKILTEVDIKEMLLKIASEQYKTIIEHQLDVDLGFGSDELQARFRVNVFHQNRGISVAMRCLPLTAPTLTELNLPKIFIDLCAKPNGLVLVTGPTGSGKSTTLAAMIDYINSTQPSHILTIEDPIEYVHSCKKSLVQQREVKKHTEDFNDACVLHYVKTQIIFWLVRCVI